VRSGRLNTDPAQSLTTVFCKEDPHIRRAKTFPVGLRQWVAVEGSHTHMLTLAVRKHFNPFLGDADLKLFCCRGSQGRGGRGVTRTRKGWLLGTPQRKLWAPVCSVTRLP